MENNKFSKTSKTLVIGDFDILFSRACSNVCNDAKIPYSGMAFYQPKGFSVDFQFKISDVEPDDSGKLIFGSNDFVNPVHLYKRDTGYYDWIVKATDRKKAKGLISFRISSEWEEFVLYQDETNTYGERAFHEFGSLFSYAVLNHHACVLHGVVMEYEGKGILVTAPSGTGKTTHTRMWRDHKNALIINGDRCLCRKVGGRWYAYGMPWSGSSGEYINRKVPISCIVSLKRGDTNHAEPMSVFDGTIYLMQRIFAPVWQGDLQTKGFDLCEELASEIPMLEFFCRPDLESVEVLERAVMQYGL